jgi:DMSO/TMAO reductase YedYZ molybdopterin-dependent catalytic subunit
MINLSGRIIAVIFILLMVFAVTMLTSCLPTSDEVKLSKSDTKELSVSVSPDTQNSTIKLTPIEDLGITGVTQDVDIAKYRLTISGLVENPISLTYENILTYPPLTEIAVLNCPGYFVDVAEWTGVPVVTILAEAGIQSEASQLIFYAVDGYSQAFSLEHINDFGVFLAYKVNGQTLPPEHGYPLRIVDKGSEGYAWIKWVERIEVE